MKKNVFTIKCYGKVEVYDESQRSEMIEYYREGMEFCEGHEAERYERIYYGLLDGEKNVTDEF